MLRLATSDVGVAVGWESMQKAGGDRIGELIEAAVPAVGWLSERGTFGCREGI